MLPLPHEPSRSIGAWCAGALTLALAAASPSPTAATAIPPTDYRNPEVQLRMHSWTVWTRVLHAVQLADRFGRPVRGGPPSGAILPPEADLDRGRDRQWDSILEYRQMVGGEAGVIARIDQVVTYPQRPGSSVIALRLSLVRLTVPVKDTDQRGIPLGPVGAWAREQFDQPAVDAAYREAGCTTGYGPCVDYVAPPIESPEWHALRNWIEVETYYADTCPALGPAMPSLERIGAAGLLLDPAAREGLLGSRPHDQGRPDNEAGHTSAFDTLILRGTDPAGNPVRYHSMRSFGADSRNPVELAWQAIQSVRVACTPTYKGPPVMPAGYRVPPLPATQ